MQKPSELEVVLHRRVLISARSKPNLISCEKTKPLEVRLGRWHENSALSCPVWQGGLAPFAAGYQMPTRTHPGASRPLSLHATPPLEGIFVERPLHQTDRCNVA